MGSVHSIDQTKELERFFDFLYGDQTGYVYCPTKDPHSDSFTPYFFEWPTQKLELITHVRNLSHTHEVYYGPALFNDTNAKKESFRGTYFVWTEFDGTVPNSLQSVPIPHIRIQSSISGHEHWYWKLTDFISSTDVVENITRRLAYCLGADLSCWDANQVLRPPGTHHHNSAQTVTVLTWSTENPLHISSFTELPEVPFKLLNTDDIHHVPNALDIIAKYPWQDEDFEFFKVRELPTAPGKPKGEGHRSSALAKLGHICMEMGLTNAETLSLLLNADERWGKYKDRKDQKHRLLGIINYCRSKHVSDNSSSDTPVDASESSSEPEEDPLKVFNFREFMSSEIKLEWIIQGLIHKKGFAIVSGPPDTGKSQLSLRIAEKLAKGEQFLKWKPTRPVRMMFVSMEMPHEELQYTLEGMDIKETEEFSDNFLIVPVGYSLPLTNKAVQEALTKKVEEFRPEGIFIDSLGTAIGENMSSETVINDAFRYVNRILRGKYGAFVWFVHHPRKSQVGNKKPNKLDDLYGNQYIGAQITTAISMWPSGSNIELTCLKLRMAKKFEPFIIRRTPNIDFALMETKISRDKPILGGFTDLGDTI